MNMFNYVGHLQIDAKKGVQKICPFQCTMLFLRKVKDFSIAWKACRVRGKGLVVMSLVLISGVWLEMNNKISKARISQLIT